MDNLKIKDGLCTYVWERLRVSIISKNVEKELSKYLTVADI